MSTPTSRSAAGHTPGPWRVEPSASDTDVPVVTSSDEDGFPWLVARVWNGGDFTQKEINYNNARLIAAAPDLLDAAQGALSALERIRESHDVHTSAELALQTAIAAATGG